MKNGYQTKYDDLDDVMDIGASAANYTDDDSKQAYKGSFITLMYEEIQKIEEWVQKNHSADYFLNSNTV